MEGEKSKVPYDELYDKVKEGLGLERGKRYSVREEEKETTPSERSGAVSGNSSSEGLPTERSEHLSRDTHAEPLDAAKV